MGEELLFFLKDFIDSIQAAYNAALESYKTAESAESKEVYRTSYVAYWIVLDKLQSQLTAFDLEEKFGDFVPQLGKPCV